MRTCVPNSTRQALGDSHHMHGAFWVHPRPSHRAQGLKQQWSSALLRFCSKAGQERGAGSRHPSPTAVLGAGLACPLAWVASWYWPPIGHRMGAQRGLCSFHVGLSEELLGLPQSRVASGGTGGDAVTGLFQSDHSKTKVKATRLLITESHNVTSTLCHLSSNGHGKGSFPPPLTGRGREGSALSSYLPPVVQRTSECQAAASPCFGYLFKSVHCKTFLPSKRGCKNQCLPPEV